MYQQAELLFHHCVSPVHMGAGTALGLIDNPIQREVHNQYPVFAGSGIKGALRQILEQRGDMAFVNSAFGPDTKGDNLRAGAVAFSDAQLLAFPVRSANCGFVYAVSATSLARLQRALSIVECNNIDWSCEALSTDDNVCLVADDSMLLDGKLVTESYAFGGKGSDEMAKVANWLADNAFPQEASFGYFKEKLKKHLVLLPDFAFSHFVKSATVVEPHVKIDDETGSAADGALFYTECLPPESLMFSTLMFSRSYCDKKLSAEEIQQQLISELAGQTVQFGGDSTTGRGLITLHPVKCQGGA